MMHAHGQKPIKQSSSYEPADVNVMGSTDLVVFDIQGKVFITLGIQIIS